jgi:exo-1,4-beta-D-glucosaminidase
MRRATGLALAATVILAAGSATPAALAAAPHTGTGGAPVRVPTTGSATVAGSSAISDLGSGGWKVLTSASVTQTGKQISTPGFDTTGWLSVTNDDAGAPGTEVEALLQNGACPDVFFSDNMKNCFGQMTQVGKDTIPQFSVPWWFRADFAPRVRAGQDATLIVNGVVGKADVWVDGKKIAPAATVTGAYTRFSFDITGLLQPGTNSLAIKMYPNNPNTMFTLDDVDWNQIPPDNNTGIQFPVQLQVGNALTGGNAHVVENNAADLSSSALTVKSDVTNTTGTPQTGVVTATITPPGAGTPITVSESVTVAANTTQTVTFDPSQYPSLTITAPQVWWPYQLGAQPLYGLATSVSQNGAVLNSTNETFGIRTVTSYLTGASPEAPDGVRAFKINGVPIVIRGGGFSPDIFLHYSAADTAKQIALMKNLGINTIRLEGHIMPEDFFEQMDRAGMLINAGYQCCDRWQLPENGHGVTAADYQILQLSALTIGQNLRNHPSVFSFQWSDNAPIPEQETVSLAAFEQADFQDPIISSAEYNASPQLGPSGEKEGPYDWVPPDYWYDTTHFDPTDSTRTNVGGSWGYDSEQSAGDTVPTLDSINRFMSAADQANLWQNPSFNQFHTNYEGTGHTGYSFGTLYNFDTALTNRYGPWPDLTTYVQEAQVANYENTRAQFEAFIDHSTGTPTPSTGTIYWQVNKGWPSLLWNLYNNDGDQAGAYFGAQKANEKLHVLYATDNGTVTLDNLGGTSQSGLSVESKVYDLAGGLLDDQRVGDITLASQQVASGVLTPKVPAVTVPPAAAQVYFVELLLRRGGAIVDRNVYWLSTQQDVVDWPSSLGNPQAAMSQFASLQALHTLPATTVSVAASTRHCAGRGGADLATTVTITNNSATPAVGFFLRADVRRGTAAGAELPGDNELRSSIWNGNDITLWPGESQALTVTYNSSDLHGATPVISLYGWNVAKTDVAAPAP